MSKKVISFPTVYPADLAERGEHIYQEISSKLEEKHRGEFAAIEVNSGKYFLGRTQQEAFEKAKKHFPDEIFYFVKIGFPAVVTVSSYQQPVSYGSIF